MSSEFGDGKCAFLIIKESECFNLEYFQKCFLDDIGSGRVGHHEQGGKSEHDLDDICSLTI